MEQGVGVTNPEISGSDLGEWVVSRQGFESEHEEELQADGRLVI
jgi:hypothetical protein